MIKITLEIQGMACSMCEEHMNDAVRKALDVKKSHHLTKNVRLKL